MLFIINIFHLLSLKCINRLISLKRITPIKSETHETEFWAPIITCTREFYDWHIKSTSSNEFLNVIKIILIGFSGRSCVEYSIVWYTISFKISIANKKIEEWKFISRIFEKVFKCLLIRFLLFWSYNSTSYQIWYN